MRFIMPILAQASLQVGLMLTGVNPSAAALIALSLAWALFSMQENKECKK